jgi:3'-phosphoadenosine 5'-phosphosulfate sulfotransferase (PAPS reductase)/FAD synthetase
MSNYPTAKLFHIVTGIGCKRTRRHVHETVERYGWPLVEIHAADCGQSYEWIVRKWGFPGPAHHHICYQRLKERPIALLVKRTKTKMSDKVLLATGIREDESLIRMGYKGREINRNGAQVWVNPIYWWSRQQRDDYLMENQIRRNPVTDELGISGECMCGAFAHPGELAQLRAVDPELAGRIDALHDEIKDRFPWGWEGRPPRAPKSKPSVAHPLCVGCEKSAVVQAELAELSP